MTTNQEAGSSNLSGRTPLRVWGFVLRGVVLYSATGFVLVSGGGKAFFLHPVRVATLAVWLGGGIVSAVMLRTTPVVAPSLQAGSSAPQLLTASFWARRVKIFVFGLLWASALWLLAFSDTHGFFVLSDQNTVRYAGLSLFVLGGFLRLTAIMIRTHPDTTACLTQTGPYRFIQHPEYTGGLILLIGLSLAFRSLLGLAIVVGVAIPLVLIRIKDETSKLRAQWGDTHAAYCASRWQILPFIY